MQWYGGALLNGCVVHSDLELGVIAANQLIELEEGNAGNYVCLQTCVLPLAD